MLHPSNALTVPSTSQSRPVTPPGPWASGTGPRVTPDILTYSYASRMVYVTPGDTYDVRPALPLIETFFFADGSPLIARHRYRQGVLPRTQERRARPDQLGGPRPAQEPANSQDR